MKRSIATATLALIVGISLAGCNQAEVPESESNTYKITFVQSGQNNVVKEVNEGETLSEVPEPFPKTGYTVTWSRTDFSNITENLTVNAVETANEYTITYDPGDGTIESLTQKVTYDSSYTLSTPISTNELSNFLYWKRTDGTSVVQNGVWKIADDVTLTAVYSDVYTVAFVQNGQEAILRQVGQNGTLTDIPSPASKTGYTVTWDRTDFTNITGNLTVNAVETASEYKITYSLGDREDDSNAEIESREQTVVFDSPYTLYIPKCEGYKFVKWVITGSDTEIKNGTWSTAEDVSLTAVWTIDKDSDIGWSDFY